MPFIRRLFDLRLVGLRLRLRLRLSSVLAGQETAAEQPVGNQKSGAHDASMRCRLLVLPPAGRLLSDIALGWGLAGRAFEPSGLTKISDRRRAAGGTHQPRSHLTRNVFTQRSDAWAFASQNQLQACVFYPPLCGGLRSFASWSCGGAAKIGCRFTRSSVAACRSPSEVFTARRPVTPDPRPGRAPLPARARAARCSPLARSRPTCTGRRAGWIPAARSRSRR